MAKTKICSDCGKRKPLEDFYIQKGRYIPKKRTVGDGRRTECRECHNQKTKKIYLKDRRYWIEYHRNYYNTVTKVAA